ncbi:sensor histidine kinase [Flavobacterium sp.]|uniref:ATP-binding protein n=1 Tax=Flavobacterium sp. TaxID=239 RepID=UPI00263069C2|nr:sensor histidine kinase [Flavobacterium sp.]
MCARTDSLSIFFDRANDDELSYEVRHKYNDEALKIISNESNDSINRIYHFKVAARYYNMNAMEDYEIVSRKIIDNSRLKKDTADLAEGYSFLGDYFASKFISDSAYKNYNKSQKLYRTIRKYSKAAKNLLNQSVIQFNEKDYVGSEKSAFETLRLLKKINNVGLTYDAYNLLGVVYNELKEFGKSLEYHEKALNLISGPDFPKPAISRCSSLNNIGLIYQDKEDHITAIKYFKEALSEPQLFIKNAPAYTFIINNLGYSEFKLRKFKEIPSRFYQALRLSDSLKIPTSWISSKLHLSEFFAYNNDTLKALELGLDAYNKAKSNDLAKQKLLALRQLSIINPKHKVIYDEEYIKISDSLQLAERQIRNKLGRIEFETDELAQNNVQLVEQRKTLIYSALGIILIGVLFFVIRVQRAKNRELRLIQEQQKANEEIYNLMITQQQQRDEGRQLEKKRIARELHDGVMGQLSAIRMNLFVLDKKQDEQTIKQCLPHVEKIQDVEREIRNIAYDLDAPLQSNTDFTEVIHTIFASLEQHSGIRFVLEADDSINWNSVLVDTKVQLYRILQEALQNIVKYANAGKVMVSIGRSESMLRITVQDDGIGFDPEHARKGLGLRNMRQRAQGIGGTMTVTTALGAGTKLEISIPFSAS